MLTLAVLTHTRSNSFDYIELVMHLYSPHSQLTSGQNKVEVKSIFKP